MRIVDYQNIANLIVSSGVALNLWCYYNIQSSLDFMLPIIFIHFCGDMYFAKVDLKLHHFLGLVLIVYKQVMNVDPKDSIFAFESLYKTELSTFFYVLRFYVPKRISLINDILFFVTFFKFRIYDYIQNVIVNDLAYSNMEKYPYNEIYFIGAHGMFLLNIYWFMLLCKVVFKNFIKDISVLEIDYLTHKITSYTMFLNVIVGGYVYSFTPSEKNILDMTGLFLLSMSSYNYHHICATLLYQKTPVEYTSNTIRYYFLLDNGSIHLRSFLCAFTGYYLQKRSYIPLSFLLHVVSYFTSLVCSYFHKNDNRKSEEQNKFLNIQYMLLIIPSTIDVLLVSSHAKQMVLYSIAIYSCILPPLLLKTEPFYGFTHIAFHISLMIQTYYLCICNSASI